MISLSQHIVSSSLFKLAYQRQLSYCSFKVSVISIAKNIFLFVRLALLSWLHIDPVTFCNEFVHLISVDTSHVTCNMIYNREENQDLWLMKLWKFAELSIGHLQLICLNYGLTGLKKKDLSEHDILSFFKVLNIYCLKKSIL